MNVGSPRLVTVACTQLAITNDVEKNRTLAESIVRQAANDGAQIILLQELFDNLYFCQDQFEDNFCLAESAQLCENRLLSRFCNLSKELRVVLPISFFEKVHKM
jgi:N-carbamoylputrescine amidase